MSFTLLGILNAQAAAAGGAGAYDLLETTVLTSSASSVSFTGLGSYSDYKHLQIRGVSRTDRTEFTIDGIKMTFNADTSNSYSVHRLRGTAGAVTSTNLSSFGYIDVGTSGTNLDTANVFGSFVCDILDFASSNKNTTIRSLIGINTEVDDRTKIELNSGGYFKTDSITEINLESASNQFISGTRFSLYGLKG